MFRLKLLKTLFNFSELKLQNSLKPPNYSYCQFVSTKKFNHASATKNEPQTTETESEKDFLIRIKNDPDIFGGPPPNITPSPEEIAEEKYFEEQPSPSKKLSTKKYADIIKNFIKQRKIKEAIDVLETRMLKEDRVKPENYIYNLLLGACGTVGYTKKALSLYNQMKKRALKVTGGTYTALFNACANSPWPEDGLTRAKHLQNIMVEKMHEPNDSTCNAMIKAFGRCGDLGAAFSVVDQMIARKMPIRDDTMNFLLQACISDKEAGFRHSLLVWRKMMIKRIKPSKFTYNLMLRSVRDCGIGDIEVMTDVLENILQNNKSLGDGKNNKLLLESGENNQLLFLTSQNDNKQLEIVDNLRPNLMARVPHMGNILSFTEVTKPEDRLLLIGGAKGFLENMDEFGCKPDIKTFTILLDCLPGSLSAENELLKNMKKMEVKPDIDFFNMLIKKRSMRFEYESAKDVVNVMEKWGYRPDLITYGVLALGCKTSEEAQELIEEMKNYSYRLNTEILGAMLNQACHQKNFKYVLELMEMCIKENIPPNKKFMKHLSDFKELCYNIINDKENKLGQSKSFVKGFTIFKMRYKTWCNEVTVEDDEKIHPWQQFRQNTETNIPKFRVKQPAKFKARHTSRFRVKTSARHKE